MDSWYYQHGELRRGPVGYEEILRLVRSGEITRTTNVWCEGWISWQRAGEVKELFPDPPPFASASPTPPVTTQFPHVDNHLTKAILVTILCCWPLGVVAIVKAAQVNERVATGRYEDAMRLSREADTWGNWSIGVGFLVIGAYFIIMFASSGC